MGEPKNKQSEAGYVVGAWDWAVSLGTLRECGIRLSLWPTTRRGVWRVVCAAVEVVNGQARGVRAKVEGEWPDAHKTTLAGFLFQMVCKLDAELEHDPLRAVDA